MRDKREVNERDRAIAYRARNHGYQGLGTPMLGVRPFYFDRTLGMTNKTHDGMLAKVNVTGKVPPCVSKFPAHVCMP